MNLLNISIAFVAFTMFLYRKRLSLYHIVTSIIFLLVAYALKDISNSVKFIFPSFYLVVNQRPKRDEIMQIIGGSVGIYILISICNFFVKVLRSNFQSIGWGMNLFLICVFGIIFLQVITKYRKKIARLPIELKNFLCSVVVIFGGFILFLNSIKLPELSDSKISQIRFILFIAFLLIILIVYYFYSETIESYWEKHQQEREHLIMERYVEEIEQQSLEIRKFKHDYQNILSSLEVYILDKDIRGLTNYYYDSIKPSAQYLNENNLRLQQLSRIKVKEVKSLLTAKLMMAQDQGISVTFEATSEIEVLNMSSIDIVRVLGIFIDNAIEEIQHLQIGKLHVGVINNQTTVSVVIQNDCREDIPHLHQLKKEGFSLKGDNRGLGLSNAKKIIQKCETAILETRIENQQFIQILTINK
ncbi:GHKL domain-containing protein [Enterococcus sp. AZ007]|uniref:GHKL domain-containing protein n=1 Tax=Enterococcus sp. AZ007 TaxID=2774839 RepID=UPI003F2854A6